MSQFMVYQNKNTSSKKAVPFLLDIQSDLLQDLKTTVVIPLYDLDANRERVLTRLTPVLQIEGKDYLALTPQLAGISRAELGKVIMDAAEYRDDIINAIDFMLAGV